MSGVSIDLLRHGDTGQRSYRGQLDDALSEPGWSQLRAAVEGQAWDAIVASTLQRCAAFARELANARGLPLRLDARLAEYHFGDWQGVPIEDIDRVSAGSIEMRTYSSQRPQFAVFALLAAACWAAAAGLKLGVPYFQKLS